MYVNQFTLQIKADLTTLNELILPLG